MTRTSSRSPMAVISSASARSTVDGSELLFGWPKHMSAIPSATYDETVPPGASGVCPVNGVASATRLPTHSDAEAAADRTELGVFQRIATVRRARAVRRRDALTEAREAVCVERF